MICSSQLVALKQFLPWQRRRWFSGPSPGQWCIVSEAIGLPDGPRRTGRWSGIWGVRGGRSWWTELWWGTRPSWGWRSGWAWIWDWMSGWAWIWGWMSGSCLTWEGKTFINHDRFSCQKMPACAAWTEMASGQGMQAFTSAAAWPSPCSGRSSPPSASKPVARSRR